MLVIQSWELTEGRAEFEQLMTDLATIRRITNSDDGQGGNTPATYDFTNIPCRVVDLRVNRPLEFELENIVSSVMTVQVIFPNGTDIQPKDRIIVNGVTYEPIQDNDIRTDNLLTMVTCMRLE